jgi:sarcosine oxidase delta subunit
VCRSISRAHRPAGAHSAYYSLADNVAQTIQYVWQHQDGCEVECYGTAENQSVTQGSSTLQAASGSSASAGTSFATADEFFAWVTNLAASFGATVQTINQLQGADCLEHCGPQDLAQEAEQRAVAVQSAAAGQPSDAAAEAATETRSAPATEPPVANGAATLTTAADASGSTDAPAGKPRRETSTRGAGDAATRRHQAARRPGAGSAPPATLSAADPASRETVPGAPGGNAADSAQPAAGDPPPTSVSPSAGASEPQTASAPERGFSGLWLTALMLAVAAAASILALRAPRNLNT